MIVIPAALAGIVAILEPLIAGAVVGVALSGAICTGSGAVNAIENHGSAEEVARRSADAVIACAQDGTLAEAGLVGGAFGGVGHLVGPALNTVGSALKPIGPYLDDLARPIVQVIDDAALPVVQAVDDAARPVLKRFGIVAHSARMSTEKVVTTALRSVRRGLPPPIQRLLPKTSRSSGFVYVMDDTVAGTQKIGMSIDPKRRLGEVRRIAGKQVHLTCAIPTYNMRALEKALHKAFAGENLPNTGAGTEWFSLSAAQVSAICR